MERRAVIACGLYVVLTATLLTEIYDGLEAGTARRFRAFGSTKPVTETENVDRNADFCTNPLCPATGAPG